MRRLGWICVLAAVAAGQEGPPAPSDERHDELGFPIIFNGEIVTENDVMRLLGADQSVLGSRDVLRSERDRVLRMKLELEVASAFGVTAADEELKAIIEREVDTRGGWAKFAQYLAQRGDTRARYEEQVRQTILSQKMNWLFMTGISHDQRTLLPQRVSPTPREVRIAWENDPDRRAAKPLVRYYELEVALTKEESDKFQRALLIDGAEETEAKMKATVAARLDSALADLADRPFQEVARERGVQVDEQAKRWFEVDVTERPESVFLRTGKPRTRSEPIRYPDGRGYRILYLIERKQPERKGPTDPAVADSYETRIRELRAQKWRAHFSIQALDRSTVQPARVLREFRALLVAELRDAETQLKRLGLH